MENKIYDLIIIGSGPSGLTAGIYATRANLSTLLIAGVKWGGQLMLTSVVENYPGFPEGIQGPELMQNMRTQAEKFGAQIIDKDFSHGDFSKSPFTIDVEGTAYQGKSVILATGADTMWLGVPGEKEKIGKGVSSCAPCDAFFFKNKNVVVVGGGDSAMEEAIVLAKFATTVTLIHRREEFRASDIMLKRVKTNPKIKMILNSEVKEIVGQEKVTSVKLFNNKTNQTVDMPIDGVFVAIGHIPNTKVFQGIDLDERGFVKVAGHTRTNVEGVFVAGDVHDAEYKQAVTAAGFGAAAALEAERWLESDHE